MHKIARPKTFALAFSKKIVEGMRLSKNLVRHKGVYAIVCAERYSDSTQFG